MSNRIDSNNSAGISATDFDDQIEGSLASPRHETTQAAEGPLLRTDVEGGEDAFERAEPSSSLDEMLFPEDRYTALVAAGQPALTLQEAQRAAASPLEGNRAMAGFAEVVADPSVDLDDVRESNQSIGKDARLDAGTLAERLQIVEQPDAFKKELVAAMRSRPDAEGYTAAELVTRADVMLAKVADDVEFAYMDAVRDRALVPLRDAQEKLEALHSDPMHRREVLTALVAKSGDEAVLQRELVGLGLSADGAQELASRLAPLHHDDAARAEFAAGQEGADTGWLPWQDGEYVEIDQALRAGVSTQKEALDDLLTRLGNDEADNSRLLHTPIFEHVRASVDASAPWSSHLAAPDSPVARVLARASERSSDADSMEQEQIAFLQEATKKVAPDALVDVAFGAVDAVITDHEADLARTANQLGMASDEYTARASAAADEVASELGEALADEAMKAGGLTSDHEVVKATRARLEKLGLPEDLVETIIEKSVERAQEAVRTTAAELAREIRG